MAATDRWAEWLRTRRHGGDQNEHTATLASLVPIRDRLLDLAEPLSGASLLDIGCGDGLIGVGALDRVGSSGRVTFCDISENLLDDAREAVAALNMLDRATFVVGAAERLDAVRDGSVAVATTRSVLIYVNDKRRAFGEIFRVLEPSGRMSISEPINRLMFPEAADRFWGYDVGEVSDLADRVKAAHDELEDPGAATMMDFDERDLLALATEVGFRPIHLELHCDLVPGRVDIEAQSLETLLNSSPSPLASTVRETIERALDATEQERFLANLARAVASNRSEMLTARVFLVGTKPGRSAGR